MSDPLRISQSSSLLVTHALLHSRSLTLTPSLTRVYSLSFSLYCLRLISASLPLQLSFSKNDDGVEYVQFSLDAMIWSLFFICKYLFAVLPLESATQHLIPNNLVIVMRLNHGEMLEHLLCFQHLYTNKNLFLQLSVCILRGFRRGHISFRYSSMTHDI